MKIEIKTQKLSIFLFQCAYIANVVLGSDPVLYSYSKIVMHAMLSVVSFYEKMGYHIEGDAFDEQGITFMKVVKDL